MRSVRRTWLRYVDRFGVPAVRVGDVTNLVRVQRVGWLRCQWEIWDVRVLTFPGSCYRTRSELYPHTLVGRGVSPTFSQAVITTSAHVARITRSSLIS